MFACFIKKIWWAVYFYDIFVLDIRISNSNLLMIKMYLWCFVGNSLVSLESRLLKHFKFNEVSTRIYLYNYLNIIILKVYMKIFPHYPGPFSAPKRNPFYVLLFEFPYNPIFFNQCLLFLFLLLFLFSYFCYIFICI